jgi:hypothetical protein
MRSCGNQAKAARYRARLKDEAGAGHDAEHDHEARPN